MVNAQGYIDGNFTKATVTIISISSSTTNLEGDLVLENYPNLDEINLNKHALTSLTVKNCPKLRKINVSNNYKDGDLSKKTLKKIDLEEIGAGNVLQEVNCGDSLITEFSFANLKELAYFSCPKTPTLNRFKHLSKSNKLQRINVLESAPIVFMHEVKYNYLNDAVEEVKRKLGLRPEENLPTLDYTDSNGIVQKEIDTAGLATGIEGKVNSQVPQLKTDKKNAEKERDEAKQELESVKTERDQLKQQLAKIRSELGIGDNATQQQVLDKIKSLMNRPTGPVCTHTDYDDVKTERDRLKTDNENKKRKIEELEGNKENGITKKAMVEKTNELFNKLNISSSNRSEINKADSVQKVEEVRDEIINNEFSKLKGENDNSIKLSIGLGVLAIGSLILLGWVLMKQNSSLQLEPKKEKEK